MRHFSDVNLRGIGLGITSGMGLSILYADSLSLGGTTRGADLFNYAYSFGIIAAYLFLFIYFKRKSIPILPSKTAVQRIMYGSSACLVLGIALMASSSFSPISAVLEVIAGLLVGSSFGLLYYFWLLLYSQRTYSEMRASILASWIIGSFIFAALIFMPPLFYLGSLALLTLVLGGIGARAAKAGNFEVSIVQKPAGERKFILEARFIFVAVLTFGFVSGIGGSAFLNVGEGFYLADQPALNHLIAEFVSTVIAIPVFFAAPKRTNTMTVFLVAFAIVATAAILLPFMGLWYVDIFNLIVAIVSKAANKFLLYVCASIKSQAMFRKVVPLLLSSNTIGVTVGIFFGENLYTLLSNQFMALVVIAIAVLYLVFLAFVILSVMSGRLTKPPAETQGESSEASHESDDRRVLDSLSKAYALTDRETEILELLVKGRSASFIAKKLYLSINTVKGYSKNLYAKLDIHSKQELIDLFENERSKN